MKGILKRQPPSNFGDRADFNSALLGSDKIQKAQNTKMASLLLRLNLDIQEVQATGKLNNEDAVITFKACKLDPREQQAYDNYLNPQAKNLVKSGKFTPCQLVDLRRIQSQAMSHEIVSTLYGLIQTYGVKFDVINALPQNECEALGVSGILAIANFVEHPNGIIFKKMLVINADKLNQSPSLTALNATMKQEARPPDGSIGFVYESLKDIVIHEYGHLLTTPNTTNGEYENWMQEMRKTKNNELIFLKESRKKYNNNISNYASDVINGTGNGAEMLAEIFCRYQKGNMLVAPEWAETFNQITKSRWGINPKIQAKTGNNLP